MDISNLDHAEVLAALYNASKVQGLGFLQATDKPMTKAEAAQLLVKENYFDYLHGKVMKIKIQDQLDTRLYNRDNGEGAAERVISRLQQKVNN